MASIGGLGSGIDTASIVQQLMAAERVPEQRFNALRLSALSRATAWGDLNTRVGALRTAAEALDTPAEVRGATATSSDPTTVTAVAGKGSQPGSVGISVTRLASAQLMSSPALTSPNALAGEGSAVLTSGMAATGVTSLKASGTAATGGHTIQVIGSSAAATATGATPPSGTFSGQTFSVALDNGTPRAVTLTGTYDATQLADEIGRQLGPDYAVRAEAGRLVLESGEHGSEVSLTLSGPDLSSVGLVPGTRTGRDGMVMVDGGEVKTFGRLGPGIGDLDLGDGLSLSAEKLTAGNFSANIVRSTATTTVGELATMLSAGGGPASAALVNTGAAGGSPYRILLSAAASGAAGSVRVDATGTGLLSQLTESKPAVDAELKLGTTTVTRGSNTLTDVLPGTTLTLLKPGDTTVDSVLDREGLLKKAQALVDGLNGVMSGVATQTTYDVKTSKGAPLSGNSSARSLGTAALGVATGTTGPGSTKALSQAGITVGRDGRLTLNADAFKAALTKDPDGVGSLLTTFSERAVTWAKAVTGEGGAITTGREAAGAQATARQKQMDAIETRLVDTERRYKMQFARLDASMGQLTAQSNRLASQIGSLPAY